MASITYIPEKRYQQKLERLRFICHNRPIKDLQEAADFLRTDLKTIKAFIRDYGTPRTEYQMARLDRLIKFLHDLDIHKAKMAERDSAVFTL
jgi:hypothetical protein